MNLRIKDVPVSPAYVVCHDEYDKGAMEIWPMPSVESAEAKAKEKQDYCDNLALEGCHFRAYTKLPRVRVWKLHNKPIE